ncbi:MAG: peptide chain release factor N(5)-glutamine methyltransferase [Eubacteriales bacterium]|nr:peptide chain release factor N(5)-glutamine methyltransferase [Eubacteriales bacterium]
MLTIHEAIRLGTEMLKAVPDPKLDALALLEYVTGEAPLVLLMKMQENLTAEQEERFRSLLLLRTERQPLHYLLGSRCFFGYDFLVDSRVLIPRQETEMLCDLALKTAKNLPEPRVLDVCTGSGAIAVVVKLGCPRAAVTGCDLSGDALEVARENARRNYADIRFLQGDLLSPVAGERFDVIVSNPPYVDRSECDELQPEVMLEPRMALDGGADGLDFYRRLAAEAPDCLAEGGMLLLEVGDRQSRSVTALLHNTGRFREVRYHRDLYGKERYVTALLSAFPT